MFCGILIGVVVLLQNLFPDVTLFVPKFWLVFGFMAGITFIAYTVASIGLKRNPETGIMAIMASIGLKMIFCMAFVLIYSIKEKGNRIVFTLDFFSLYLLFTAFEIFCLLRNLRHQNLK
ncbi:hypothetical protein C7T94_05040 [Pedobacter yulinensis]|uniref:Uncharacterized protein n=1 Tax=Pedobacter yulinensis TaxID=2126353 RepID=A0A2T3HQ13_9SPHI|nr:hypothetical protein C7T94_05040 [Pedobacter yulinensis]